MATLSFVLMVGIFKAVIKLLFIGFRGYALPVQLILCWVTFTTPEYFVQKLHLVRHLGRGLRALITAAVERIEAIPSEILQSAADGIPGTWLAPVDHGCLTQLLIALGTRRQGLGAMMARHLTALGL